MNLDLYAKLSERLTSAMKEKKIDEVEEILLEIDKRIPKERIPEDDLAQMMKIRAFVQKMKEKANSGSFVQII